MILVWPGWEEFSREELIALVSAQAKLIGELQAEVAELKRQAGRNSQNSSVPPSADGLAKATAALDAYP